MNCRVNLNVPEKNQEGNWLDAKQNEEIVLNREVAKWKGPTTQPKE